MEYLNALFYLAISRMYYCVYNSKDYFVSSAAKSPEEIIKCFLRTQILANDFAKLIEAFQSREFLKVFMCVEEIYPDFDAAIEKAIEQDPDPDQGTDPGAEAFELHKYYIRALKKAVEENDTERLYGNAVHEHVFAADWSHDQTKHWHAATCGHEGVVSDFGGHAFGEKVKLGDKTVRTCTVCGYEETDDGSVIVPEGKKLVNEDAVILQAGEIAVSKTELEAAGAATLTIIDGTAYVGVSVRTNGDLTAKTKSWGKVKFDKDVRVDVSEDGTEIVIPVPANAQQGFMVLESGEGM